MNKTHTGAEYAAQRRLRGTQIEVAKALNIFQATLSRRETRKFVSLETWMALVSLPVKTEMAAADDKIVV